MTSKRTNKFAPEVRERAVRMVFDNERDHPSRWATVVSIAEKIGCVPQTPHDWVNKAEVQQQQACRCPDGSGRQGEGAGARGPRAAADQWDYLQGVSKFFCASDELARPFKR